MSQDIEKVEKIVKVLRQFPKGTWLSDISVKTGLAKSTLWYYLFGILNRKDHLIGGWLKPSIEYWKDGNRIQIKLRKGAYK